MTTAERPSTAPLKSRGESVSNPISRRKRPLTTDLVSQYLTAIGEYDVLTAEQEGILPTLGPVEEAGAVSTRDLRIERRLRAAPEGESGPGEAKAPS